MHHGANEFPEEEKESLLRKYLEQFKGVCARVYMRANVRACVRAYAGHALTGLKRISHNFHWLTDSLSLS